MVNRWLESEGAPAARFLEAEESEEIQATLHVMGRKKGEVVAVRLQAAVTEVGTLELTAIPLEGDEHWKVQFNPCGSN